MKRKLISAIIRNRKKPMSFEILRSREYFYPLDENGNEKNVEALNFRVRYCVREDGSNKILKCFSTLDKAKRFVQEMEYEANKANNKNTKKDF